MNTFLIYHGDTVMGAADYADEARAFAERLAGDPESVYWEPTTGKMYVRGNLTGWKVMRSIPEGWFPVKTLERVA